MLIAKVFLFWFGGCFLTASLQTLEKFLIPLFLQKEAVKLNVFIIVFFTKWGVLKAIWDLFFDPCSQMKAQGRSERSWKSNLLWGSWGVCVAEVAILVLGHFSTDWRRRNLTHYIALFSTSFLANSIKSSGFGAETSDTAGSMWSLCRPSSQKIPSPLRRGNK